MGWPYRIPSGERANILRRCGKNEDRVCRNHYRGGLAEAVARRAGGDDRAAVAGRKRIDPVVVDVAVEDLEPLAGTGKPKVVRPPRGLTQCGDDDDVRGAAVDPAVKRDHTVLIVHVK